MIQRYDEAQNITRLKTIEANYEAAIKLALGTGATFWSVKNDRGIGLGDALTAAGIKFDSLSPIHLGITAGFFEARTSDVHADYVIGVKIGARLRRLLP